MKHNPQNPLFILGLGIFLSLISWFFWPKSSQLPPGDSVISTTPTRSPGSIKNESPPPPTTTPLPQKSHHATILVEHEEPIQEEWQEKLKDRLLHLYLPKNVSPEEMNLRITTKSEYVLNTLDNKKIPVSHVLIQWGNDEVAGSSFDAEIDRSSGEILKTWNRPVYHSPPMSIQAKRMQ